MNSKINYGTIADIIYAKACVEYKRSKRPIFEITDFEVFKAMAQSGQSYLGTASLRATADALNQIMGASATYKNKGIKNCPTSDWDEDEESILLILKEIL